MHSDSPIGTPIPALDGHAVDDQETCDDSTVVSVETDDERDMVQIDAWDDGLGLDVSLLLTLPHARTFLDHLSRAIQIIEERQAATR
ncbi:hypothetical protein [Actinomadura rugatobispora]|uniref:Uncharacterized protein n=1 Tax=Actinomadura rugatobispora TaxID=1994 RepID=A0ABW1A924_9ACTN|nr:hypothetical protein GCM10010200_041520 [Actinomadura rugatobispora]